MPDEPVPESPRRLARLAALVAAASLLTYAGVLWNGFAWDDHEIVERAPAGSLADAALEALTTPDVLRRSQPTPYYRPVTRLLLVGEHALFGPRPFAFHLVSLLLHAAAALALLPLGRRLLGSAWTSTAAALLFALHPVNAETVSLAAASNNILVALLGALACSSYLEARERRRLPVAAAVLFGVALGCKESAVMLLPFFALLELVPPAERPQPWRARLLRVGLMALAAAPYAAARQLVLAGTGSAAPLTPGATGEVVQRVLHGVPRLLGLLAWPAHLTVFHPLASGLTVAALVAAWGAIGVGVALLLRARRPAALLGLAWAALQLAPVSGLVPIPSGPVAERYLYLPAIGLAWVAVDLSLAARARWPIGRALTALGAAVALLLAGLTARRTLEWRDDLTLYAAAVRVDPTSTDASYDLAVALDQAGDGRAAAAEWARTLTLEPDHVGALSQLGTQAAAAGDFPRALALFERVLAREPRDAETRFNVALLLERAGRPAEALTHYRRFLRDGPADYPELVPKVEARIRQLERAPTSP